MPNQLWSSTLEKVADAFQQGVEGSGFFTIKIEVVAAGTTKERQRVYLLNEVRQINNKELHTI